MAGKYNNKKKGAASYSGKWRKTSGKSGATRALKSGSKQDRQVLTHFTNNKTKGAVTSQSNLVAQGGNHSSCIENIPIQITSDFESNWTRFVQGKYEEFRISKFEVKLMFANTEKPVHYQIDKEKRAVVHPDDIAEDPSALMKLVNDTNRNLVITWTPKRGSSDMDYQKVDTIAKLTVGDAKLSPLAYIKVLQYDLPHIIGSEGCSMQTRVTLSCRGLVDVGGHKYTDAQLALRDTAINLVMNSGN